MSTWRIARFTFREAVRKKAVLGAVVLTALFVLLFATGLYFAFKDLTQLGRAAAFKDFIAGQLLLLGLYAISGMAALLAIFTSVGTIAGEVEQGTLHAIVPKPLHRWEIVAGKWLGYAAMLSVYTVVTSVLAMLLVNHFGGYLPPRLLEGVALMTLETLLLLSLAVLGSTFMPTVVNGIVVFMLYSTASLGGMLEQLGSLISNDTMVNIGVVSSLVIPSDAIWRMAAGALQPPLAVPFLASSGLFTNLSPSSAWMLGYTVAYTLAATVLGALVFTRRDL